jgi:hypothetical protein
MFSAGFTSRPKHMHARWMSLYRALNRSRLDTISGVLKKDALNPLSNRVRGTTLGLMTLYPWLIASVDSNHSVSSKYRTFQQGQR